MFKRFAIAAATFGLVVVVSGCASPLTQATLAQPNANGTGEPQHGRHRAQPASTSYGDLLYAAPLPFTGEVAYYTYPAGKLVGTLNATARGLCSDTSGNVFLVNEGGIGEYAHGGTSLINTLGSRHYNYWSCSVDPTSGNLAVTFEEYSVDPAAGNLAATSGSSGGAGVAIFKKATGEQTTYTDSDFKYLFYCGYDGSGNLFADGQIGGNPTAFAELAAGGTKLRTVQLNQYLRKPGQVQWDGTYVTVGDEFKHVIYRTEVKGSSATVVGRTVLRHSGGGFRATWIYEGKVIAPLIRNGKKKGTNNIGFWNYPQGGSPTKVFQGPSYGSMAVTISSGS